MADQFQSQSQQKDSNMTLKLAIAIALLRSKFKHKPPFPSSQSDALRWKRKAKERKREILSLKQELSKIQEETQYDPFTDLASCKCHFFDDLGKLCPKGEKESEQRFSEVLRRRFLRQVRWKQRKTNEGHSVRQGHVLGLNGEDEIEQLSTSADFLVELCSTLSQVDKYPSFASLSHQAVDFILASLKSLLSKEKNNEQIEDIVTGLIGHLVRRMSSPPERDGTKKLNSDAEFNVQHLLRKLGSEPYIGLRTLLLLTHRITGVADSLLFMDPFDNAFPALHNWMFMLVQLTDFLISDYTKTWTASETFDKMLFEECIRSILSSQKPLKLLESRSGLYMLYMDRIKGELVKQLGSISSQGLLYVDILDQLLS